MSQRARSAKDRTLIVHIGLHKTATTYVQNVLSVRRYDLLARRRPLSDYGDLGLGRSRALGRGRSAGTASSPCGGPPSEASCPSCLTEIPDTAPRVLLSSEDFSQPRADSGAQYIRRFSDFGSVKIVLVLRRQDDWIESYYKQVVNQYGNFETRSFEDYLERRGARSSTSTGGSGPGETWSARRASTSCPTMTSGRRGHMPSHPRDRGRPGSIIEDLERSRCRGTRAYVRSTPWAYASSTPIASTTANPDQGR